MVGSFDVANGLYLESGEVFIKVGRGGTHPLTVLPVLMWAAYLGCQSLFCFEPLVCLRLSQIAIFEVRV